MLYSSIKGYSIGFSGEPSESQLGRCCPSPGRRADSPCFGRPVHPWSNRTLNPESFEFQWLQTRLFVNFNGFNPASFDFQRFRCSGF